MQKYRFISPDEMEQITSKILVEAGMNIEWRGMVESVDIDALIEFKYNLNILWDNIDHLDVKSEILAAINPATQTIIMNESKKDFFVDKMGTMNFTKAHELGHWVLHVQRLQEQMNASINDKNVHFCRDYSKKEPEEVQADMFAANLLMPRKIITGAIAEVVNRNGKVRFSDLYDLRDQFDVSISALVNRTKALNLLKYDDKSKEIFVSR